MYICENKKFWKSYEQILACVVWNDQTDVYACNNTTMNTNILARQDILLKWLIVQTSATKIGTLVV